MGEESNLSGIQAALYAAASPPIQIITRCLADFVFSRFEVKAAQILVLPVMVILSRTQYIRTLCRCGCCIAALQKSWHLQLSQTPLLLEAQRLGRSLLLQMLS